MKNVEINNLDVSDLSWVSSPLKLTARPFYQSSISAVDVLKREIEMQEQTIENLRKSIREEVIVKSVRELRCPNCNAPLKLNSIKKDNMTSSCEYCGSLLEFLTKE